MLDALDMVTHQEQDDQLELDIDCEILHLVGIDSITVFQIVRVVDCVEGFDAVFKVAVKAVKLEAS